MENNKLVNNQEGNKKKFTTKDIIILVAVIVVTAGLGIAISQSALRKETKEELVVKAKDYMENKAEHSFKDATCTSPKTCTLCGKTEGETLEHEWIEATSKAPKTCKLCGLTEGDVIKPFMAENGISFSKNLEYDVGYIVELCDADVTGQKKYESITVDKPTPAVLTIEDITVEEADKDYDNVIIKFKCEAEPEFTNDISKPSERWVFVTSLPSITLCDYYTGTVFGSRATLGSESFENTSEFVWDNETYDISFINSTEIQNKWGDWKKTGKNTYNCLFYTCSDYTLNVRIPKNYDGLVLKIDKKHDEDSYDYNNDYQMEDDENLFDKEGIDASNVNDKYIFIRLSDIK